MARRHRAHAKREATPEEFKALSHALRLRILRLCLHDALTNKQIADRLHLKPATALHHVRLLVHTGFLKGEDVRSGNRGALERPYRATGKSWVLSVPRDQSPQERVAGRLVMIDALRAELAEVEDEEWTGARLGLQLSPDAAEELRERINAFVRELSEREDDPGGDRYGFFITLHRQP